MIENKKKIISEIIFFCTNFFCTNTYIKDRYYLPNKFIR